MQNTLDFRTMSTIFTWVFENPKVIRNGKNRMFTQN